MTDPGAGGPRGPRGAGRPRPAPAPSPAGSADIDPDRQRVVGAIIIVVAVVIGLIVMVRGLTDTPGIIPEEPAADGVTTTTVDRDAPPPTDVAQTTLPPAPAPADVVVVVANGSGVTGLAARTGDRLATEGYQILPPTDTTADVVRSSVYYIPGSQPAAAEVATALGLPSTVVSVLPDPPPVTAVGTAQVVVVLGADFTSAGE